VLSYQPLTCNYCGYCFHPTTHLSSRSEFPSCLHVLSTPCYKVVLLTPYWECAQLWPEVWVVDTRVSDQNPLTSVRFQSPAHELSMQFTRKPPQEWGPKLGDRESSVQASPLEGFATGFVVTNSFQAPTSIQEDASRAPSSANLNSSRDLIEYNCEPVFLV
jgi:hypothetical protein